MKNPTISRRRARGFTLIEIMVVVVIMGVLAALVVPKLLSRTGESKVAAAKVDIATVMQALKLYKLDNQRYPTSEQGLQALLTKPTSGPAANGW
ncbi:MAG: type II secretion system major pseudopilin GspG, partial [Sphingomonadaceae bacterium]